MFLKKRISIFVLLAVVIILSLAAITFADTENDELAQFIEDSGITQTAEELSPQTRELMRELGMDEISLEAVLELSPENFLRLIRRLAIDRLSAPLKGTAILCAVTLLCAAADSLKLRPDDNILGGILRVVGSLCCCASVAVPAEALIDSVCASINECANFLLSFIPVYTGMISAGGKPASAASYNAALFGVAEVIGQLAADIIKPLMGIFLAFALVGVVAPSFGLADIAGGVKKTVNWALGLLSTVFVSVLGLQSTVSAAADTIAMKTAKFAVSSTVPVVGGALAEAMNSAAGYLGLLRSVTGAFGIAAGTAIFLPTVVDILLWRFGMGIASFFSIVAAVPEISKAVSAVRDVLDMLLALTMCTLLVTVVAIGIILASFQ